MPKLTYYYAERLDDSDVYSVVATTLKEAQAKKLAESRYGDYGPIQKRVFEYKNAYDMFEWLTGECGHRGTGYVVKEYKN